MKRYALFHWVIVVLLALSVVSPAAAQPLLAEKEPASDYQTGVTLWRGASGFSEWALSGTQLAGEALQMDITGAVQEQDPYLPGEYYGGSFYNGGSYLVGEAISPVVTPGFAFTEAIASWNAVTPPGTWVETLVRAQLGGRWTKWYNLGIWASDTSTVARHSVSLQGDADGFVAVDTLVLAKSKVPADSLQVKVRLFSTDAAASPSLNSLALTYSTTASKKPASQPGNPALWNTLLDLPLCSQMVYPDGGNVWCSPTSTSMVLGYWGLDSGPCEPRVRAAVEGVYDWRFDGHGNWPFNTAYAASRGLEGYVVRYPSLAELEPWVAAGIPVIMSIAWSKGELTNAQIPSSDGHLLVLVGFDATGNAVVNDPAAASDAGVRVTYLREELESIWLKNSGGTVYLIYPPGWATPDL